MIAWVELKNQHMIDAAAPPAVDVDAPEENKFNYEKWSAVKSERSFVCSSRGVFKERGYGNSDEKDEEGSREKSDFERRPG